MDEKINIQDLAARLAEKEAISKKEAESFLREFFEVASEAILSDKLLKIKDWGTFKLSPVENRESVDVVTGERVLIPAHYKIAFSPDKQLAQAVNEPFSLFEPIEIEADINSKKIEEKQETKVIEEKQETEAIEEKQENEAIIEKQETEAIVEKQKTEEIEEKPIVTVFAKSLNFKEKKHFPVGLIAVFVIVVVTGIEFVVNMNPFGEPVQKGAKQVYISQLPEQESLPQDTIATVLPDIGEKRTITRGDRLTSFALKEYGNKVFWVYIYEENKNHIKNPDILMEGLEIVIPSAQKYGIDANSQESVEKAKNLAISYNKH
ncbi:MAG: HU family DNA-binding protein [Candidatus Symbiothrix sp.]|jgi:nucleoid DNA-binding protein|nr:HU family DNA-binding protein [Candidatus Symbiothrix sp.]